MTDLEPPGPSGLPFQGVLIALFKHKWKIIICALLGLVAAGAVYYFHVPVYQSEAHLLVKYVVDRSLQDDSASGANRADTTPASIINSEVAILESWDLIEEVAQNAGGSPKLASVGPDKSAAARRIRSGLKVMPMGGTNVVVAAYKDRDRAMASAVLTELVTKYFAKHLQVHGATDPKEAAAHQENVKTQLTTKERELDGEMEQAGIISLREGAASLTNELNRTYQQLQSALAEYEEQRAFLAAVAGATPASSAKSPNPATAPPAPATDDDLESATANPSETALPDGSVATNADLDEYRILMSHLGGLRQNELGLLGKFLPDAPAVKTVQAQIRRVEAQRDALVKKFPELIARTSAGSSSRPFDIGFEQARLVGVQAKIERLKLQYEEVKDRFKKFGLNASVISRLEREKNLKEKNFEYVSGWVERATMDAQLQKNSQKNMPNISVVQRPSPAVPDTKKRDKLVLGLAGSGLGLGIALALFLELLLNRTVKRPLELESRLHIPLMLAIPRISQNGHPRLKSGNARKNGRTNSVVPARASVPPWDHNHFIRPFSEVVRDRLAMFFEVNGLDHKPKLVGVAGFSDGAGASTLAGGLAAALSETGDGKVLLVDMNIGHPEAHPFFKGQPAYSLTTALHSSKGMDSPVENLYLATVNPENDAPIPVGLKKFHMMMPNLKASDYDYIIFDMPRVSQASPTMTMAPYMDKMLLVVEAEENDRDMVKRRHDEMIASNARVSVIFNKARHYGPRWLEGEV